MTVRVGINGFGRIGRTVFRILAGRPSIEVVGINDLFETDQLAYLLQYDTVMGRYPGAVVAEDGTLSASGRRVRLAHERDPEKIPWREWGASIVIESTGAFRKRAEIAKHLAAGAERVILTVPPKDDIDAMVVIGVNDETLRPEHRLVSNASCTTNCLAPVAKILDDAFGIEDGLMSTVHAYTNDQRLADVPHKDLRRSRAAALNIIPTSTGAARAVGKILPKLKGKIDGIAMRVPVPDGSIVELVCRMRERPGKDEINAAVRSASMGRLARIVEYSEAPLVSTDIIGNPHSAVFDSLSTRSDGDGYARVLAWYDNEWGYSERVADLVEILSRLRPAA
ncbi:MAG TPA: type I glyceraldehyde-3-phosphate dehydrogenase [Thermoanaerobaculia bacterium]|nr:type I glyceraldehyde-3-phosphate dehydrogenase [Thermoanaerobaculia bacterium]